MNELEKLKLKLRSAIPTDEVNVLDVGSEHPSGCVCETCCRWWVLMGPDGGEAGRYGPFTRDQVIAEANEWGKPTEGLV